MGSNLPALICLAYVALLVGGMFFLIGCGQSHEEDSV